MTLTVKRNCGTDAPPALPPPLKKQKTDQVRNSLNAVALSEGREVLGNVRLSTLVTTFLTGKELNRFALVCSLFRSRLDIFLQYYPRLAVSEFLAENPGYQEMNEEQRVGLYNYNRNVEVLLFDEAPYDVYYHSLRLLLQVFCRPTQTALRELHFHEAIPMKHYSSPDPGALDMSPIAESPNLEKLTVTLGCRLQEANWKALLFPPKLRELRLRSFQSLAIPEECESQLKKLTLLKIDDFHECDAKPENLQRFLRSCSGLTALAVRSLERVSYVAVCTQLSQESHPHLRSLDLYDASWQFQNNVISHYVDECEALQHLGKRCGHLTELNLEDWNMSGRSLKTMQGKWPKGLRKLTLSGYFKSMDDVALIPNPRLEQLRLVNCRSLEGDEAALRQAFAKANRVVDVIQLIKPEPFRLALENSPSLKAFLQSENNGSSSHKTASPSSSASTALKSTSPKAKPSPSLMP